jgi:hypothetical protein
MKKSFISNTFIGFLILFFAFTAVSYGDMNGKRGATWGCSKAHVIKIFQGQNNKITEEKYRVIITPLQGTVTKEVYSFKGQVPKLFKIVVHYSLDAAGIVSEYSKKYGNPTKVENGLYQWLFPSTTIEVKAGSNFSTWLDPQSIEEKITPDPANIDKVQLGMSIDEIKKIMGEPIGILQGKAPGSAYYNYSTGRISIQDGKVSAVDKIQERTRKGFKEETSRIRKIEKR